MQSVGQSFSKDYAAQPASVARARHAMSDFAAAAGAQPRQVEAIALATSEAFTNAVVHAYRDRPGRIHVTAALVEQEIWVLIADDGCGLEPRSDRPGLGLGLGLIAQLSDHLAIVPRAGGGTEVRMRFNLIAAPVAGAPAAPELRAEPRGSLA
jgi:serine/threonine-protein kinase RsbW/stage II sporulation protein AB (anti-sigma F factor)